MYRGTLRGVLRRATSRPLHSGAILAIENCLLRPLEHIFTSQTVVGIDEDQVRVIAIEPANIQKDRKRLNEELRKLLAGI
jgi:hypothetical protein